MTTRHEHIVVGGSLTAVLYAFINNYPLVFTESIQPFRFDYFEPKQSFECLKIPQATKTLLTFNGERIVGVSKVMLWERLLFLMALDGKVLTSGITSHLRCDIDRIVASNDYSKIGEWLFDECHYFDDQNSHGFVSKKDLAEPEYLCYDWVAFNRGGKHDIDFFSTDDKFVQHVWFYSSDRIDGSTPVKDACVVSQLTQAELLDFDYSETMARFKLVHEMEARGMKGKFNGYGPNGNPKYYKFRTSGIARTKSRLPNPLSPQASNICLPQVSDKDMLKSLPQACMEYDRFLRWL